MVKNSTDRVDRLAVALRVVSDLWSLVLYNIAFEYILISPPITSV